MTYLPSESGSIFISGPIPAISQSPQYFDYSFRLSFSFCISLSHLCLLLLIVTLALFFSRIRGWGFFVASVIIGCFLNAIVFLINIFMGYDQHQKTPLC
ncbi:hypothetical protein SK128_000857 [Halocaridina rubra]|uniref:Uncharacterized protein n=1 Tax=Halocaridina rubra TaxID=373956 RepID=A0AAN9A6K1_HALRR